ncbi:MAG TPA: hypothetical protein VFE37_07340 [Chloroflexota bacterium]|nr:hypothetical protein [Chloroflexota bacterium]
METKGGAAQASLGSALERTAALSATAELEGHTPAQAAAPASTVAGRRRTRRGCRVSPAAVRRWLVPGVGALAVAAGVLLYTASPRVAGPAPGVLVRAEEPTVVGLQGDTLIWRPGAREATAPRGAAIVGADDRVQTGPGGRASVAWPRGAVATLEPQSGIQLLPSSADGIVRVQVLEGRLWLDGGGTSGALTVEALTPDGARVVGRRFQVQRDSTGRLLVATTDAPATVTANDGRQELPPGSTSEVLVGRQPALPRPALVPPALVVAVEGAAGWAIVDPLGRAVGQPAEGGGWLDQIPAVRGPLPRERGTAAVLPDPAGEYRLLLWGSDATRAYRVAVWPTDGQVLYSGPAPSEAPGAARQEGEIPAGAQVVLNVTVRGQTIALAGAPSPGAGLPEWLRVAVPAGPRLVAAPSATAPAVRQVIVGRPPPPPSAEPAAGATPAAASEQPDLIAAAGEPPALAAAAPTAPDETTSGTVAAALAVVRGAATPAADTAEAAAGPSEAAPEATATAGAPSFGISIPGVPRAPAASPTPAAALAPLPAFTPVMAPTPLVLQRVPEPEPTLGSVRAPALSGTVTASRGVGMPPAVTDLYNNPPPSSAAQSPPARAANGVASVPPGALPQSVPPGGQATSLPPGGTAAGALTSATAAGALPNGPAAGAPAGLPANPAGASAGGVAGTPAEYPRPVAVGAGSVPLDTRGSSPAAGGQGLSTASGNSSLPGGGAAPGAAAAAPVQGGNAAPAAADSSLSARAPGTTLLSGTAMPAAGALHAAPPLSSSRGAAPVIPSAGAAQAALPNTNHAAPASRPR